jgi:hypothetical protein
MRTKCGIWKSAGDRFTRKFLNLKFMMSHEFLYTYDTGEREISAKSEEMRN